MPLSIEVGEEGRDGILILSNLMGELMFSVIVIGDSVISGELGLEFTGLVVGDEGGVGVVLPDQL